MPLEDVAHNPHPYPPPEGEGIRRSAQPERPWALAVMRRMETMRTVVRLRNLRRIFGGAPAWPPEAGAYRVGDPNAPVAACTLTSNDLIEPVTRLSGVAIAGRVYTANLGVERIVLNVTANPRIRFLLLCGRDSPLFHPGQTLQALCANGVDRERRVVGATGYLPVLRGVSTERIERFRQQVELVDCTGETDLALLAERASALTSRDPGPYADRPATSVGQTDTALPFRPLRPGGKREPLAYDPKGYFLITLDRRAKDIVVRHYLPDNTPANEMRGHSGESLLLGLLRAGLVSQLSHAGYLGGELAKAEAALQLGLVYEQDQRLRVSED
jgi:tetrahydromethanopterin S-methyltransferase subunit A